MSRLERLVNLTAALLAAQRPLTAEEIGRTIPGYPDDKASFKRQFERDKDALRRLGMPIEQEAVGAAIGYRIAKDGYHLHDPGLAPDELSALQLAARTVALDGFGAADALWKLGGAESPPPAPTAVLAAAAVPASSSLPVLFDAITESRAVSFAYRADTRTVVPRALSFRTGHWYLDAHDLDRGDARSFRVDRISGDVRVGDVTARPPAPRRSQTSLMPWEIGDAAPIPTTLLIDAHQAPWAIRYLGEDRLVERRADGAVVVTLNVVSVDAMVSFVLGFLAEAEVLAPAAMRDAVVQWLVPIADGGR
jgi:predicted DNA-binding transcriptional regulator YafY